MDCDLTLPTFLNPRTITLKKSFGDFLSSLFQPKSESKVLNRFVVPRQKGTNWCWAAVTTAVANFFDAPPAKTQCEIAAIVLGKSDCDDCHGCSKPCDQTRGPVGCCDQTFILADALSNAHHPGKFHQVVPNDVEANYSWIKGRINQQLPICCVLQERSSTPRHAVGIYGYEDAGRLVYVGESRFLNDKVTVALEQLLTGYHRFVWIEALLPE